MTSETNPKESLPPSSSDSSRRRRRRSSSLPSLRPDLTSDYPQPSRSPADVYAVRSSDPAGATLPNWTAAAADPPLRSLQPTSLPLIRKRSASHVSTACANCKRAHLACDSERPCRRCVQIGRADTCVDVEHKRRGRPRLQRPVHDSGTSSASSSFRSLEVNEPPTVTSSKSQPTLRPSTIATTHHASPTYGPWHPPLPTSLIVLSSDFKIVRIADDLMDQLNYSRTAQLQGLSFLDLLLNQPQQKKMYATLSAIITPSKASPSPDFERAVWSANLADLATALWQAYLNSHAVIESTLLMTGDGGRWSGIVLAARGPVVQPFTDEAYLVLALYADSPPKQQTPIYAHHPGVSSVLPLPHYYPPSTAANTVPAIRMEQDPRRGGPVANNPPLPLVYARYPLAYMQSSYPMDPAATTEDMPYPASSPWASAAVPHQQYPTDSHSALHYSDPIVSPHSQPVQTPPVPSPPPGDQQQRSQQQQRQQSSGRLPSLWELGVMRDQQQKQK